MAKQAVGPLIRHLEKGVLAATAGAFLFFAATYGVVSPSKVDVGGETVGPRDLDQRIGTTANSVRERLLSHTPEPPKLEDPVSRLNRAREPLAVAGVAENLPRPVGFGALIPELKGSGSRQQADLLAVVSLTDIEIETGRSGVVPFEPVTFDEKAPERTVPGQPPPAGLCQDLNWATIHAVFNRQAQEDAARQAGYDPTRVETIFLGMDLERRTQNADGTFTEWQRVPTAGRRVAPRPPAVQVTGEAGNLRVDVEQEQRIKEFYELVRLGENQLELMRPLFADVCYGDSWTYPRRTGLDLLQMDAEYQVTPACRYPECTTAATAGTAPDTQNKSVDAIIKEARKALDDKKYVEAKQLCDAARRKLDAEDMGGTGGDAGYGPPGGGTGGSYPGGPGGPGPGGPGGPAGGGVKPPAPKDAKSEATRKRLAELEKEIDEAAAKAGAGEEIKKALAKLPTQVLWAHDATPDGLVSGRVYQYRARARIYHRYCGVPFLLKDGQNAAQVELTGPWTESGLVYVKPDTQFFVKSSRAEKRELKVEVFKWLKGDWYRATFDVVAGEPIGGSLRTRTREDAKATVDFNTQAVAVDIDFARQVRARNKRNQLQGLTETAALVFVDANGRLIEKLEVVDSEDELYKELRGLVWKPPKP